VVYKQIEFTQSKNLGLNKDNIITFKKEWRLDENMETFQLELENMETFQLELENIPGVINVSRSYHDLTGRHGSFWGLDWEGRDPDKRIQFQNLEIGYDWFELFGIEMIEGRTFSREFGSTESKVIFNEAAIAAMGITDPIGKIIELRRGKREIIGVTENFHFESLYESMKPCVMQYTPYAQNVLVKIKAGIEQETIEHIEDLYQEFNQGLQFDYHFLDQDYKALYASDQRVSILSKYFAGIAILISCLGLYGLASFTNEKRQKEIGVRKTFGASGFRIGRMLGSDFSKTIIVAISISLPISYLITKKWLDGFAYRIDLKWWYFVEVALLVLLIAWFTIGLQTIKAARVSPVQCLKDE
jgi:hypothetical protein